MTCSSGLRGEWARESGAGSPCWGQCRGASDKLEALLLTAGSTVMSILCPVWSPQQTYYPNQINKGALFVYCLVNLSTPNGEFHVGNMWLSSH